MYITSKTFKKIIFLTVILSLFINLANFIYTEDYFKNYSDYNSEIKSTFYNERYNSGIGITEDDLKTLCLSLKPDSFLLTYNKLVIGSFISIVFLLAVFWVALRKDALSRNYKYGIIAVLTVLSIIWFYAFILEADYDFISCAKFL